jgi:hypothetical protein
VGTDPIPHPQTHSDPYAFSLWCPTPLQRLYRSVRLSDDAYELTSRRASVVTAIAWLPLFVLSAMNKSLDAGATVPFLRDLDLQARLLVALPLLVVGEVVVHRHMPLIVRQFVERRIVVGPARDHFDRAAATALRISRSVYAEILILACVATIGAAVGTSVASLSSSTWYAHTTNNSTVLTPAGWWYVIVSRPLFQFVLLRWYFRLIVWIEFLWEVSRLRLQLMPTHPDRRGGLGFLFALSDLFVPFLLAHGTMLAGRVANGVLYAGLNIRHYEVELVAVPVAVLLLVLAPELMFSVQLWRSRRKGLSEYGMFAQRYVRDFDHKWLRGHAIGSGSLLGSADIQSLADLANSFQVILNMRFLPTRETILTMGLFAVLPLAPLPLTMISGRDLLERVIKMML